MDVFLEQKKGLKDREKQNGKQEEDYCVKKKKRKRIKRSAARKGRG